MAADTKAYLVAARRSAIGKVGGLHRHKSMEKLAAPVIQAVLADAGVNAADVDEIVMGNAAGGGGNPARLVSLAAGFPVETPAITLDRQCASGLDAIIYAARLIECGAAQIVLAGGGESPSTAPWRVKKPQNLYSGLPSFYHEAAFAPDAGANPTMLEAAEIVAQEYGISREQQDEYALLSHSRAAKAKHQIRAEMAGLNAGVDGDESVKDGLKLELLARMPPCFPPDGTVTAGNSCAISDGTAFVLMVSEAVFHSLALTAGLLFRGAAQAGVNPRVLGIAAVPAVQKLLRQEELSLDRISTVEFNEAFAAQVLASLKLLGLNPQRINRQGGALAFGHPYGASGAVLAVRLFSQMVRGANGQAEGSPFGLALVASAGGLGVATLFERIVNNL